MTNLLTRAFEEVAKLPPDQQDEVARRLLDELCSTPSVEGAQDGINSRRGLQALVGLLEEPIDVDAYLDQARGPGWAEELDGKG